jgi:hypothetical protein
MTRLESPQADGLGRSHGPLLHRPVKRKVPRYPRYSWRRCGAPWTASGAWNPTSTPDDDPLAWYAWYASLPSMAR